MHVIGALWNGSRRKTLTRDSLRSRSFAAQHRKMSHTSALAEAEKELEFLAKCARKDGLGAELAALEHPEPPKVIDRDEPTTKVRLLTSISTEHEQMPYYGAKGDVMLVPPTFAKRLERAGYAERVPDDTPVYHQPVAWR
jgi:hypothetical protein